MTLGAGRVLLERPVALQLPAGSDVVVQGAVRTSFDGAVFDAATRTDTLPDGTTVTRTGGFYDLEAGGLRVVSTDARTHEVHLVASGADAPGCRALGLEGACLVPRVDALARERLMTRGEFLDSLTGDVSVDAAAPTPPSFIRSHAWDLGLLAALGLAALAVTIVTLVVKARRSSALGRVREAAREAHAAIGADADLAALRAQIAPLVERARDLERSRLACNKKLAGIDRKGLEARRARWSRSTDADAVETLAWVNREIVEATRVEQDAAAAVAGIARVESALRVLALNARSHRDVRARVATDDPVDAAAREMALRDEALREAEAVLGR
jgi:hypothetical protein